MSRQDSTKLTVYSTPWCGYCSRLKRQLDRDGVEYLDVDITENAEAEAFVVGANGGNATVPTVRFPDGTTLTNPGLQEVHDRLREVTARLAS